MSIIIFTNLNYYFKQRMLKLREVVFSNVHFVRYNYLPFIFVFLFLILTSIGLKRNNHFISSKFLFKHKISHLKHKQLSSNTYLNINISQYTRRLLLYNRVFTLYLYELELSIFDIDMLNQTRS